MATVPCGRGERYSSLQSLRPRVQVQCTTWYSLPYGTYPEGPRRGCTSTLWWWRSNPIRPMRMSIPSLRRERRTRPIRGARSVARYTRLKTSRARTRTSRAIRTRLGLRSRFGWPGLLKFFIDSKTVVTLILLTYSLPRHQ